MKAVLCMLALTLCACGSDNLGESFSLGPEGEPDELSLGFLVGANARLPINDQGLRSAFISTISLEYGF